jgi:SAM-dependent methyltransferase
MGGDWKAALFAGPAGGVPQGYRREGEVLGRDELLDGGGPEIWSKIDFVGRAQTPYTTSAVEAEIRRRHLERLVKDSPIDPGKPTLELGCGDGLVTGHLLDLGFRQLVSTDIQGASVARLGRSLGRAERERVLLVVDDLMRLPFAEGAFETVIAWGVLSVSGDFERGLERAWSWLAPGGHLLLAEPVLESVLVYALVRGDLDEFKRTLDEGTRAALWDRRDDRYPVNSHRFYLDRLADLPGGSIVRSGGINMLPSLILGGVLQDSPLPDEERAALAELLTDPALDDLRLWRQAYWLVEKR